MKHVLILRHAKSSWADPGQDDHDRPLNARGERAAVLMARVIAKVEPAPDLVLCSTALRTRQTLAAISGALNPRIAVAIEPDLYLAGAPALLHRLCALPETVTAPLLIGHNPGLHELAMSLAGAGEPALRTLLGEKFPTAALAQLSLPHVPWSALKPGLATLDAFTTPRAVDDDA